MGKLTSGMQRNYAGSVDERVKEQQVKRTSFSHIELWYALQLLMSIRKTYEQKAKEMAEQRAKDLLTESWFIW